MTSPRDRRASEEAEAARKSRMVGQSIGGSQEDISTPARERVSIRSEVEKPRDSARRAKGSHLGPRGSKPREVGGFSVKTR